MTELKRLVATVWDDGLVTDLQLLDILKQHNVRASFAFSPGVYGDKPTLNDVKHGDYYGYRLAKSDLLKFQDHDICNHTLTHCELVRRTPRELKEEIVTSRQQLQRLFQQEVRGFVYPYGVWDAAAQSAVLRAGHTYSRITKNADTPMQEQVDSGKMLIPSFDWYQSRAASLRNDDFVLITGHTYQIECQADWDRVDRLYADLTANPEFRMVTMTELAMAIQVRYQFESCR